MLLTCVCQGPGSIDEDHVCCQGNNEHSVGQSHQSTLPFSVLLWEGPAERQIESRPANQAAEHFHHCHVHLQKHSVKSLRYHKLLQKTMKTTWHGMQSYHEIKFSFVSAHNYISLIVVRMRYL